MSRKLHDPMITKGQQMPLPGCFKQGLSHLFSSKEYTGFKYSRFKSGPRGNCDRGRDDGTTYN
jgi:hypothetical protein